MADEKLGILIVDDEFSVRDSLASWFRKDGYRTAPAQDATEALKMLQDGHWQVVLLDIKMPGMNGMELLERIRSINPEIAVIMMTAFASVETAVEALKLGAFDYVTKPIDPDELSHLVQRAAEQRELKQENQRLRQQVDELVTPSPIIGESQAMAKVMEMVRSVAETDTSVLVVGESGTGKELIAQAIHANSARRYFPIVPVNCGALAEGLLESELFGHEKGAFTGAQYTRKGKFEMANGGTLFLDEIGTIGARTQVDLLRVLETREFVRVGGNKANKVDLRVVCATNDNLEQRVKEGTFREDLYFRINVVSIMLPPLRERREDIPMLAQHFLKRYNASMNRSFTDIDAKAMDALVHYRWPGNVRELANAIERALVVGTPPMITLKDLPLNVEKQKSEPIGSSLADVEKAHIARVLEASEWNVSRAAEVLQIDRATLYNKIKKYKLRD